MARKVVRDSQNRNARIRTRFTEAGRRRTETSGRDPETLRVAVSTDERNNSSFMTISRGDETIHLTGREAMTVLRTLEAHRGITVQGALNNEFGSFWY